LPKRRKKAKEKGVDPYEILNKKIEKIPPGSDGLIFIPHLGGRVCPYNPYVRGSWFGFSWGHTKFHFYRAILEGIAYEYSYYFDILKKNLWRYFL